MRRPVRFCSRMCADQPAVRAHAKSGRHHVAGHVGEVEEDRGPEVDVGLHPALGVALGQLGDRGLLELEGDLVARGAEPLAGVAQDRGARVVRPVDAVPEAHQPFLAVERLAHVAAGVAHPLDALDHRLGAAGGPAVQRPRQGADRPREAGRDVGAGRGDDPRGEGRRVHAVLGRGDEVGVDGFDVLGVGVAAPADHEPLGDGAPLVDLALGHHRRRLAVGRLADERDRHDRGAGEVLAGLLVVDVEQRRKPHTGASCASADCTSTRMSPVCTGSGNGSAGGRPGSNSLSTSSPHTWPKETRPTRSLMSTPR